MKNITITVPIKIVKFIDDFRWNYSSKDKVLVSRNKILLWLLESGAEAKKLPDLVKLFKPLSKKEPKKSIQLTDTGRPDKSEVDQPETPFKEEKEDTIKNIPNWGYVKCKGFGYNLEDEKARKRLIKRLKEDPTLEEKLEYIDLTLPENAKYLDVKEL